ncbi:MAG: winged helix-turn-helix domain-containing protein [Chloroflexia bacterium]|nr:winged helix-turn-helix domain-containing protein [Chloroflexia bacterium]
MTPEPLTRDEAAALATIAQRLDRRPRPSSDRAVVKARLLETVRALGCVQLDAISVVSRTHETVLWSRLGRYDPALFAELHHPDAALAEYWAHAAALIPMEDLPLYRRVMERYRRQDEAPGSWAEANRETLARVLDTIREEGASPSRRFERTGGPRPQPWAWWGGKEERRALDHLWSRGELMPRRRIGFERVWDLTERVVPAEVLAIRPTPEEERRAFTAKALRALGVGTARWVADYFRAGSTPHVPVRETAKELGSLAADGLAIPIAVEGLEEPTWLDPALLSRLADLRAGRGQPTLTTLLSPFDSLVWHRGRALALWGFDYRLESYTPAAKRRYGYYTLPILDRGRLVGRVDPSLDRKARLLTLRAVHLEPGVRATPALAARLAAALQDLSAFIGADEVAVLASDPAGFGPLLTAALYSSVEA